MRIVKDIKLLRKFLDQARAKGQRIGFVPTMGFFHEGHLALMRQAKKENDICVVSIYVNPKQFGPKEDLRSYPRDIKRDSSLMIKENVDICFLPPDNEIYPSGYLTYIDVLAMTDVCCGRFRPGHFKGVATIVTKLLNIINPQVMYLGAKDAQQAAVLKTVVKDLNIPVKVSVMPTVREHDGLAMSSRNVYLTPQERDQASVLYQALTLARNNIINGERSPSKIKSAVIKLVSTKTLAKLQYVECVDAVTLKPLQRLEGKILVALAVYFGKTRLIDNVTIERTG